MLMSFFSVSIIFKYKFELFQASLAQNKGNKGNLEQGYSSPWG